MPNLNILSELLADESVTEVMVNGPSKIYVEKGGKLTLTDKKFKDDKDILDLIDSILKPLGRVINNNKPFADARLADGSRVNIIIPPLSLIGPMVTIRKFSKDKPTGEKLISYGSCSQNMLDFLKLCVTAKKNIVVSGGTGSGKTTLLNIMSSFIPDNERILTIEDAAELQLNQEHVGRLESRPPDVDGKGEITIRQLVTNALRMRPDRIVVGECRGGETLDMLQAMNTGHAGSLTTVHANTPRDAIKRIEVMVLMAGLDLPVNAIREQIASAVNIIVQISRFQDGSRKITDISQITGMEGNVITLAPIFKFNQSGFDAATGKISGKFSATGSIPSFLQEMKTKGLDIDMKIFS